MNEIIVPELETERFLLRQITAEDIDEWIRLKYADPEVMRYMPKSDLTPQERAKRAFGFFAGASSAWP